MKKVGMILNKILNGSIVIILSTMVLLVFLNAVMRYLFDSGITWSEELSRYSFVWIVFLGAIVAFKDGAHIIVDLLISKFPKGLKKVSFLITNLLIIGIMVLFLNGLISIMDMNQGVAAPASGIPRNTLYAVGVIASIAIIFISVYQTVRVLILNKEKPEWMKDDKDSTENGGDFK